MENAGADLVREGRLIEGLRALVERYVGAHDHTRAEDSLTALMQRLGERILLEEETLFPAVERAVGGGAFEPTRRMRRQHAVLLDLVDGVRRAIAGGAWAAAGFDLRELHAALALHLEEERRVLFPLLGAEGRGHA